jgi:transcription initiation factor TFIIIB Brf1 subunit/transcription initiation factor TFIIB
LASFCPECGGELKYDLASKNFICKSCGLFASSEKIDELRERAKRSKEEEPRRKHHDEYLDWWQSSKKDKQQK